MRGLCAGGATVHLCTDIQKYCGEVYKIRKHPSLVPTSMFVSPGLRSVYTCVHTAEIVMTTVTKQPHNISGYTCYPPGMVPDMRKRSITPHSGCFLTVVVTSFPAARRSTFTDAQARVNEIRTTLAHASRRATAADSQIMGELTVQVRISESSHCKTWYENERVC